MCKSRKTYAETAFEHSGKSRTRPEEYIDKRLDSLFDASKYQHLSNEEQNIYEREMTTEQNIRDYYEALMEENIEEAVNKAVNKAVEKAKAVAEAEAKATSQREIAKKMLSDGLDVDVISKYTGLSESEIKVL